MTTTRRSLLAGLAGLAAQPVLGARPARANVETAPRPVPRGGREILPAFDIDAASRQIIAEAALGGTVGCMVAEAHGGDVVFAAAPDVALPPASVTKAVTAAYAFDTMGPGHRYSTRVLGTGPVRDGRLDGDLVLAGGGAPGLSTADLAVLTRQLKDSGLREVTGRFRVWAGALPRIAEIAPDQPDYASYNASVSGLNLNYNRVHFEWQRAAEGYDVAMEAPAGRYRPQVRHTGMEISDRAQPVYRHRVDPQTGRELWSVARGVLGGGGSRWLPVRDSAAYAADVFRTLARAEGLVLPEPEAMAAPPQGAVLASQVSPPLAEVASGMLQFSTNLTAEVLGLSATAARAEVRPETLAGSAGEMGAWAARALGLTGSRFADHSGLSDASRTTAGELCGALARLGPDGALRRALPEITLRRDDGTPEPLALYAKTGTLYFVSALAGHIRPSTGPPLVFAILTADLDRRAAIPEGRQETPPGSRAWTSRSRQMQYDLVRLWASRAS